MALIKTKLNQQQWDAVMTEEPNILVVAGAGSGKTFTLIQAVANYRLNNPEDNIQVITYTRAATAELRERLDELKADNVDISTIHVWSRTHLQNLANKYAFRIKIMEEGKILEILKELIATNKTKIKPEILYSYVSGNKKMDVTDNYLKTLDALNKKYVAFKRKNNLYDFTDYPLYLLTKMREYGERIETLDALFVDELQDVDEEQFELFKLVDAKKKFFIGDPKQSIYIFRGADSEIFRKLDKFSNKTLLVNYRSFQEITDYADTCYDWLKDKVLYSRNLLLSDIKYSNSSDTVCIRGKGGDVFTLNPFGVTLKIGYGEVDTLKSFEKFMNVETKPWILCRTNKQVKWIEELGYGNVSTVHQAKGLEYESVIVIDEVIKDNEDLNIAYVAVTRTKNSVFIANFSQFYKLLTLYMSK